MDKVFVKKVFKDSDESFALLVTDSAITLAKVAKVTPSGIIKLADGWSFDSSGRMKGGSTWDHRCLIDFSSENQMEYRRQTRARKLFKLTAHLALQFSKRAAGYSLADLDEVLKHLEAIPHVDPLP